MLGVVLWSDASVKKAVIWCEDQGDLAYVNEADAVLSSGDFFDAGDLVQFDMDVHKSTRRASNPRLVIEKASAVLPDVLRMEVQAQDRARAAAEVIPFVPAKENAKRLPKLESGISCCSDQQPLEKMTSI